MEEIVVNLHMHTKYSDGYGSYADIAHAAMQTGLDAVLITDHDIWVNGVEGYVQDSHKKVLVLIGEEIHDPLRQPQKNHLLAFGAVRELAPFASDPQVLINQISQSGGISFIAHPFEDPLPAFGQDEFSWVDWQVRGYTGLELWNNFSEFKTVSHSSLLAIFYAFFPNFMPHSPLDRTLKKWDELLASGKRVVAIGGSDAHALHIPLGPIRFTLYPYEYHFRCVNTHLLIPSPLSGDLAPDRKMILDALREGHAFIGYDLPASTRGFRYTGQGKDGLVMIGDETSARGGVTFQIKLPLPVECTLIKDGQPIKTWRNREICTYNATQPGVYRVECHIHYLGKRRGWIFTNPIYLRA